MWCGQCRRAEPLSAAPRMSVPPAERMRYEAAVCQLFSSAAARADSHPLRGSSIIASPPCRPSVLLHQGCLQSCSRWFNVPSLVTRGVGLQRGRGQAGEGRGCLHNFTDHWGYPFCRAPLCALPVSLGYRVFCLFLSDL